MPLPKSTREAKDIDVELSKQDDVLNAVDNLMFYDVAQSNISPEHRELINKYKLVNDGVQKHYVFAKINKKVCLVLTAEGVSYLCRSLVKSAHIIGDPKTNYLGGAPINVIVHARVETLDGKSFDNLGCVEVKTSYSNAVKAAVTNAMMRALKSAIGINIPDETLAEELINLSTGTGEKNV